MKGEDDEKIHYAGIDMRHASWNTFRLLGLVAQGPSSRQRAAFRAE
jgi:hypothetical protein